MLTRDERKQASAQAAAAYVEPGSLIGVGTGSTADHFIEALGRMNPGVTGAVASSERSAANLRRAGVALVDLNDVDGLPLYVDGADECTRRRELIKGGGGALTREKIVAAACARFICVVDDSKLVDRLGAFPLPVEVIPMAARQVAAAIGRMGGRVVPRDGYVTDNGNVILDVHELDLGRPAEVETALNQFPGTVTNGLFCLRPADLLIVGGAEGVLEI